MMLFLLILAVGAVAVLGYIIGRADTVRAVLIAYARGCTDTERRLRALRDAHGRFTKERRPL